MTLTGEVGTVTVRATQAGDITYKSAPSVEVSFAVILLDTDFPTEICILVTDLTNQSYISELNFGSIISISGNEGYADNLTQSTILNRQSTTPFTVEIKNMVDAYVSVWIDYNRNGSFADSGEIVYEGIVLENSSNPQVNTEITVPSDARIGVTRMRVIAQKGEFAVPCAEVYYGEVEDYGIYLEEVTNVLVEEVIPFTIYPNPFVNEITVHWQVSDYEVSVYNHTGQTVYQTKTSDFTTVINTDQWKNGVYIVKLRDNQGKISSRILVK